MADETALKRAALLRHFAGCLQDDGLLNTGLCHQACHVLLRQQLLKETQLVNASSQARTQLNSHVEAWCGTLGKRLQKVAFREEKPWMFQC